MDYDETGVEALAEAITLLKDQGGLDDLMDAFMNGVEERALALMKRRAEASE